MAVRSVRMADGWLELAGRTPDSGGKQGVTGLFVKRGDRPATIIHMTDNQKREFIKVLEESMDD